MERIHGKGNLQGKRCDGDGDGEIGQLSMSSSQEAVRIEQRGSLLGHWTLASDLPNPPVIDDRVEKAQLPMASATGGCESERGDAQRGATQKPLRSRQLGPDRSGECVWLAGLVPQQTFLGVGHVERKAGRVKEGAREGARRQNETARPSCAAPTRRKRERHRALSRKQGVLPGNWVRVRLDRAPADQVTAQTVRPEVLNRRRGGVELCHEAVEGKHWTVGG